MELQFNKTVVPCMRSATREIQNQEQTQEVRLSDGMPDIGRVLGCWGQLLVRGKEWRSGNIGVSGGVMAWVLYVPEDGGQVQSVATWLPFQMKWDIPETQRDGTIHVSALLRGIDARSTSARKIMVRAGIGVMAEAMVPGEVEIFNPVEVPEDVHLLKNTYPIRIPVETGEKAFVIDEAVSLPDTAPALERLIRYELRPEILEQKVVSDKVVFRGVALLHILYAAVDGRLYSWDFELPFSQYAQLDKEHDVDSTAQICLALTNLELEQGEEENLNLKAGVIGQYVIFDGPMVELVEDAYSNLRNVKPQFSQCSIPAQLDEQREIFTAQKAAETGNVTCVDLSFYPDHPRLYTEADRVTGELAGMFQLLGYDENGNLNSGTYRWEDSWSMDASPNAKVAIAVQSSGKPQVSMSGENTLMQGDVLRQVTTTMDQPLQMMMGLELGEMKEPDPNRPSIILRRADGSRLWDLAKNGGSTVDAIQKANNLQSKPDMDQMLLIPVD